MGAFDDLNNIIPLKFKFGMHNDIEGQGRNEVYIGTMAVGLHEDGDTASLYFGTGSNGSYAAAIMPPPGVGILCGLDYKSSPFYAYPSFRTLRTPESATIQFYGTNTYESDGRVNFGQSLLVTEADIPGATDILSGVVTAGMPQTFSGNKSFRDHITANTENDEVFGGITICSNSYDSGLKDLSSYLNPGIIFKQTHLNNNENSIGQILYNNNFYFKTNKIQRATIDANLQGDFYKLLSSNGSTIILKNIDELQGEYELLAPNVSGIIATIPSNNVISNTDNSYSIALFDTNGKSIISNSGFIYKDWLGSGGNAGVNQLILGNDSIVGSTDSKQGEIILYSSGKSYVHLLPGDLSTTQKIYIQDYKSNDNYLITSSTKGNVGSTTVPVYVKNGSINTCDAIDISHGGTSATTAEEARENLGFTGSVTSIISDLVDANKVLISDKDSKVSASELSADKLLYLKNVDKDIQDQFTQVNSRVDSAKNELRQELLGTDYNGTLADLSAILKDLNGDVLEALGKKENAFDVLPLSKGGTGYSYEASPQLLINVGSESVADLFPKSQNTITPGVTGVLSISHGGTGLTAMPKAQVNLESETSEDLFKAKPELGVKGVLPIAHGGTGLTANPKLLITLNSETSADVLSEEPRPGVTGVLPISHGGTGRDNSPALRVNLESSDEWADVFSAAKSVVLSVTGVLPVKHGGTGANSLPVGSLLVGNNSNSLNYIEPEEKGKVLVSNGSNNNPIFTSPSMKWIDGTEEGPKFCYIINDTEIEIEESEIPAATQSISGIVTTATQEFGGSKTFNGNVSVKNGSLSASGNVYFGDASNTVTVESYGIIQLGSQDKPGSLNVYGTANITGNTTIGQEDSDSIAVKVYGTVDINDNVSTQGTLYVKGNTTVGSTSDESTLDVYGNGNFKQNLTVAKTITVGGSDSTTTNLTVNGAAKVTNNLDVTNELKVMNGVTTLRSSFIQADTTTLVVNGKTENFGHLIVGTSSATADLTVNGNGTFTKNLKVSGTTELESTLTVSGVTTLGNALIVSGATNLSDNLSVSKNLSVEGSSTIGKANTAATTTSLTVNGSTSITGNASITGSLSAGSVTFTKLKVTGQTELSSTTITGPLIVTNNVTFGDTSGNISFTVYGNETISGALTVKGNTTLGDATSDTVTIKGPTTIGSTLGVTGATTLSSTLGVTGATTLGASGTGATTTKLTVNGKTVLTGNASISGTLGVTGATTLSSTLGVTGATTLSSSLTVAGTTTLKNTLYIKNANNGTEGSFTASSSTATTAVATVLTLGNSTAVNTAGNRYGILRIYNQEDKYMEIRPRSTGATRHSTFYLPQGSDANIYATWYNGSATGVGSSNLPIYIDSTGKATACATPSSTTGWFNKILRDVSGTTELGRYLEFHATNDSANSYDVRIDATTDAKKNTLYLPSISGQFVVHDNNKAIGSSTNPVYIAATGLATQCDGVVVTTGAQTFAGNKTFSGVIKISNTTDSTSSTTGALQVSGGAYIAQQLRVGGNVTLGDATTDTVTIKGPTTIGSTLTVSGNTTLKGNVTLGDATTDTVTIKGPVSLTLTTDANPTSTTSPALTIGATTGNHLMIDNNEIIAKNGNAASILYLNSDTNSVVEMYNVNINGKIILKSVSYGGSLPTRGMSTGQIYFKTIS